MIIKLTAIYLVFSVGTIGLSVAEVSKGYLAATTRAVKLWAAASFTWNTGVWNTPKHELNVKSLRNALKCNAQNWSYIMRSRFFKTWADAGSAISNICEQVGRLRVQFKFLSWYMGAEVPIISFLPKYLESLWNGNEIEVPRVFF